MSDFFTTETGDLPEFHPGFRMLTVKSNALQRRADITLFDGSVAIGKQVSGIPVVILLHGVYGSHWAWAVSGRAHEVLMRLMKEEALPPMLLVMPSDGLYGDGSGYLPHHDADYEKWIVQDVVQAVKEQCASVTSDSLFFITGLSMGGYGALRLGAGYPGLFSAFSGMSSITAFGQMKLFVSDMDALVKQVKVQEDVMDRLMANRERLKPFRFDCGSEDLLIEHNRELHRQLLATGIPHEYAEHPGEHRWIYWQQHLADQLQFFAKVGKM